MLSGSLRLRPLQNPHLRRISALCAARSLAYLYDMSFPRGFLRSRLLRCYALNCIHI
ncbi:hypothetical protein HMPREF9371_2223 [Neisseria shayeganii 871]|uniref:Uncharacterized protein n=1 Tax=Neisseria shayeganii 871 TaxID=1032488 RepID=G4CKT3_9NEIS|nr:hypothetical protein HMPREF9371_2223 [Neisseria shayeganii 871]